MDKFEFLKQLGRRLAVLPKEEQERLLAYYAELIDDRMENGEEERQVVRNLGTIDEIVQEILHDEPQNTKKEGTGFGVRLVVFICTFPIWLPIYISIWAVIVSLCASSAGCMLGGILYLFPSLFLFKQSVPVSIFQVGVCLFAVGIGIFLLIVSVYLTKYFCKFTRFFWHGVRYSFWKRGQEE